MKIEYRIIEAKDSALRILGEEGWQLVSINDGKMYFSRELKKQTLSVVNTKQSNTQILLEQMQYPDSEITLSLIDRGVDFQTCTDFSRYWLEKGEMSKKYRWEKEKVFDLNRRLTTWISRGQSKSKVSSITF